MFVPFSIFRYYHLGFITNSWHNPFGRDCFSYCAPDVLCNWQVIALCILIRVFDCLFAEFPVCGAKKNPFALTYSLRFFYNRGRKSQSVGPNALHFMHRRRLNIKEETHPLPLRSGPLGLGCGTVETCRNACPTKRGTRDGSLEKSGAVKVKAVWQI